MKVIIYRVGLTNILLAPLVALVSLLITHICCWGPVIMLPIGLSGAEYLLDGTMNTIKQGLTFLSLLIMGYMGWKTYQNPHSTWLNKAVFWISLMVIVVMLVMN